MDRGKYKNEAECLLSRQVAQAGQWHQEKLKGLAVRALLLSVEPHPPHLVSFPSLPILSSSLPGLAGATSRCWTYIFSTLYFFFFCQTLCLLCLFSLLIFPFYIFYIRITKKIAGSGLVMQDRHNSSWRWFSYLRYLPP